MNPEDCILFSGAAKGAEAAFGAAAERHGIDEVTLAYPEWEMTSVCAQVKAAGMDVLLAGTAYPEAVFTDIGAIVFFLKVTPWQIPDFDCDRYRDRLRVLHQRILDERGFHVHNHRFLIIARKL